jgi:ATP-dependent phosphofructokinase / diphosphate-dependent phosphofructokinase
MYRVPWCTVRSPALKLEDDLAKKVGICTGGGDAPGLNAVIRAFVKCGIRDHGWEIVGIEDSFNGLLGERRLQSMTLQSCQGLLHRGGTVLGTTNRGDPFSWPSPTGPQDRSEELARAAMEEGLDGIVCIGGDGSQRIALRLMQERGIPMIGVPKTIDNDLAATDMTFGFQTAVDIAVEALDRLHTTAESHDRVMFLEVMGRDAGHIALHAGIAGGADVILIPEIPYDPMRVAAKVKARQDVGRSFTLVVVAEGALPKGCESLTASERKARLKRGGGAAAVAMAQLDGIEAETRHVILGHVQRGGTPDASDRLLATRFGVGAAHLVAQGRWGEMVALRDGEIVGVSLETACATMRFVDPSGPIVRTARATGVELGG